MSPRAVREYLDTLRPRYGLAKKPKKTKTYAWLVFCAFGETFATLRETRSSVDRLTKVVLKLSMNGTFSNREDG